jgi:serine protease inhibitor
MRKRSRLMWHRRALAPILVALLVLGAGESAESRVKPEFAASPAHQRRHSSAATLESRCLPSLKGAKRSRYAKHGRLHCCARVSARAHHRRGVAARCLEAPVRRASHGLRHRARHTTRPRSRPIVTGPLKPAPTPPVGKPATAERLLPAQGALGLRLIDKLAAKQQGANIVVSPASLAGALAVIERGIEPKVDSNLHELLGFKRSTAAAADFAGLRQATGTEREGGPLMSANAIYFDTATHANPDALMQLSQAAVQARIEDFSKPETLAKINAWVNARTKGKIPTILDELPRDAGLVALNALYFKDQWKRPFERADTKPAPFHLLGGGIVEVPLMHAGNRHFLFRQDKRFVAVDLPYASAGYSMVVVTTKANPAPAKDFANLRDWLAGTGFNEMQGEVELPRFGATANVDLMPTLIAMGFKPPTTLPAFAPGPLRLAKAQQRVELKVDEEGTQASAATAVIGVRGMPLDLVQFVADKPFVFALRDATTGLIVVVGYVANPKTSLEAATR